jgi:hypothetical protein
MWRNDPNGKSETHWLDVIYQDEGDEDYHWWQASIKWDGCIHLNHAGNVPFSKDYGLSNEKRSDLACDGYIHICDLDEYIENLIALRDMARKHFGEDWDK